MPYTPIANSEAGVSVRTKINGIGTGLDTHAGLSGSQAHALGTISTQSASAVVITGGTIAGVSISGIIDLLDVTSASADLTVGTSNDVILTSASGIGITLPTAGTSGRVYHIKNISSGSIVIYASGSETIDGDNTKSITNQYSSLQVVSDGSNWNII